VCADRIADCPAVDLALSSPVIEIYLGVGVAAVYNASRAATPESQDRWNNMLANYEGNLLGDALFARRDELLVGPHADLVDWVRASAAQASRVMSVLPPAGMSTESSWRPRACCLRTVPRR
jgi:hypothetical protein